MHGGLRSGVGAKVGLELVVAGAGELHDAVAVANVKKKGLESCVRPTSHRHAGLISLNHSRS